MKRFVFLCLLLVSTRCFAQIDNFKLAMSFYDKGSYEKAFEYMEKSANEGSIGAQYTLGSYYAIGIGVTKNLSKAMEWWQKAADQGHPMSMFHLGEEYLEGGDGVIIDKQKAIYWLTKATDYDNLEAASLLSDCYRLGNGVPKNIKKSISLLENIINSDKDGFQDTKINAELQLAAIYMDDELVRDYAKAHYYSLKAAESGNPTGMYFVGMDYCQERGVPKDIKESVKWITLGADLGHPECQFQLHLYYKLGIGVEKNSKKANELFDKAYKGGSLRAVQLLMDMYGPQ